MLFGVDTGGPATLMDKSLAPRLGKPLARAKFSFAQSGPRKGRVYRAPGLYLGNTRILTGKWVVTDDLSDVSFRPLSGILGMDCLRHYCIQLDFAANKLRFLDPDQSENEELGKAFPLTFSQGSIFPFVSENLLGAKGGNSLIDTGDYSDGGLAATLFQRALDEETAVSTKEFETSTGQAVREVSFRTSVFGGETYSDLALREHASGTNGVGLRFLARHLVTLNFPKQTIYLQRKSVGPLEDGSSSTNSLAWWENGRSALGWWDTEDSATSGDGKRALAERIVSAPNLRPGTTSDLVFWVHDQSRFLPLQISAGPPETQLRLLQLSPGDYHRKVVSDANPGPGAKLNWKAKIVSEGSGPPGVVQERGTVVLLHDYNSQKEFMSLWAFVLAQAGCRVFLVDLPGHGESAGQIVSYGKYETADLRQALDYLTEHGMCEEKVGVLGVGYGANLALHWAARDPRVRAVVAIAPYNQPEQALERLGREKNVSISIEVLKEALSLVATRLDMRWADWSAATALHQLKEPVLLIGGGKDTICSTNDLHVLEEAAPSGSKGILVPEANHWSVGYSFHEIAEPVTAWFRGHLSAASAGQSKVPKTN